ncbi:hypothetical protein ACHAXS_011507 [Conticribra weissflogii]
MLSNQNTDTSPFNDMDSLFHQEVVDGLAAAKQYESQRARLSTEVLERMMNEAFPFPSTEDDESPELSSTSMASSYHPLRDASAQSISKTIAIVQEQLTEYHSVIEKLETMTTQFQLMQQQNQSLLDSLKQRDEKINSLEQMLIEAKINQEITSRSPVHTYHSIQTSQHNNGLSINTQFPTHSFSADASDHCDSVPVTNCFMPSYANEFESCRDPRVVSHSSSSIDLTSEEAILSPQLSPVPLSGKKRIRLDNQGHTCFLQQQQQSLHRSNNQMHSYFVHQLDSPIPQTSNQQYYSFSTNQYAQLFWDSQNKNCFTNHQNR